MTPSQWAVIRRAEQVAEDWHAMMRRQGPDALPADAVHLLKLVKAVDRMHAANEPIRHD